MFQLCVDQIGTVQLKRSSTIRRFMISALRNTMCGIRPKPKVVMGHIQEKARILVHHQNSLIQLEVKWDPMPPLACQSQKYRTGTVVRANSIEGSSPPTPPYLPCRLTMVKDQSQEIITVEGLDHNLDTDLMY
uniref:SJCHGC05488 protein n=1 Tax=Schistosoma japonicum TaxID=6182 RepID=Q5DEH4_SCHJA|nr:SJCHGC05488 protein [Schistosoma japonicum]